MNKISRVLLFASVIWVACLSAFAQATSHNGYWWNDQNKLSKLSYVIGFVEGSSVTDSTWLASQASSKAKLPKSVVDNTLHTNDYDNVRFGQLSDGLDEFYKDFRNMSIHVSDAIWVAKEQAKGTTQKDLDPLIEHLRRVAASDRYDSVK